MADIADSSSKYVFTLIVIVKHININFFAAESLLNIFFNEIKLLKLICTEELQILSALS